MSIREVGARLVLDIKDAEAKIKELEKEIKNIEKAKLQFEANTQKLEQLKKRLEEIKKEKESLQKTRLSLQADLTSLNNFRNQLKQVNSDIDKLKQQLNTLKNHKLNLEIKINNNKEAIKNVLSDSSLSQSQKSTQLSSLYGTAEKLKSQKLQIENQIKEIQKSINTLNNKKISIEANISGLENAEKLAKEVDSAISDLDNEEIKINADASDLEEANTKLDQTLNKEEKVRDTKAQIQTEVEGYDDTMAKLEKLQTVANALKSMSNITFNVGNTLSNLGSNMLNVSKLFSNNIIGDIGRFFVQGIGYSSLYRLTSNIQNGIAESLSGGIERYDTINVSKRTLGVIMSDVENADAQINDMISDLDSRIEGLPTTLDQALSHISTFTSINHDVTRSEKLFNAMNDAILTFGGSAENVDSAVTQYSQIMGSKMDARTLLSMQDAGMTPVLTAIANEMGMTYAEFRNNFTGQDPTISLEEFENALIKLDEEGGGGLQALSTMAKQSVQTISNALSLISLRATKAVGTMVSAMDEVITELTGKTIYENVYDFTEKILALGDKGAQWIRDHKEQIGQAIDWIKQKISDAWDVIKQFKLSEFIDGLKEGFEPLYNFLKDKIGPIFEKVKDYIKDLGDGSISKGMGKFIAKWYTWGIKLKAIGTMLKIGSKGFSVLSAAVEAFGTIWGKLKLSKVTSKLSKLSKVKSLFSKSDSVVSAIGSTEGAKFDANSFKNKLASMATIAGGAGIIILYAKAIKEISDNVPNDITTLPMRLINLFSTMGVMTLIEDMQAGVSQVLGWQNVLASAASLLGSGGAMWLYAKAIKELDECIPEGIGEFQPKLLALIECVGAMSAITLVQGGLGLITEGITVVAQAIGIFINLGLATNLKKFAEAIKAIDENMPADTTRIKAKITRLQEIIALFGEDGDDTLGGAFKKINERISDWYKESHIKKTTSMIESLSSVCEALSSIQSVAIDTQSIKTSMKSITDAVDIIMGVKFSDKDDKGNSKQTLSDTQYANVAGIISKFTVIATNLKTFQETASGLNNEAIQNGITQIQSFLDSAKGLDVDDNLSKLAASIQQIATNMQEAINAISQLKDSFYLIGFDYATNLFEGWQAFRFASKMGEVIDKAKTSLKKKTFRGVGSSYGQTLTNGFSAGLTLSSAITTKITSLYNYSTNFYSLGQTLGSQFSNGFNSTGKTTSTTTYKSNDKIEGANVVFKSNGGPVYLARGGSPLFRAKGTDTVPAMLTPGEFVIRRQAVDKVGRDFLSKVNNMDLRGAFHALSSQYGSDVSNIVNKNVTINNVTNNNNKQITFSENNIRRQTLKANRFMRGLA